MIRFRVEFQFIASMAVKYYVATDQSSLARLLRQQFAGFPIVSWKIEVDHYLISNKVDNVIYVDFSRKMAVA